MERQLHFAPAGSEAHRVGARKRDGLSRIRRSQVTGITRDDWALAGSSRRGLRHTAASPTARFMSIDGSSAEAQTMSDANHSRGAGDGADTPAGAGWGDSIARLTRSTAPGATFRTSAAMK